MTLNMVITIAKLVIASKANSNDLLPNFRTQVISE